MYQCKLLVMQINDKNFMLQSWLGGMLNSTFIKNHIHHRRGKVPAWQSLLERKTDGASSS